MMPIVIVDDSGEDAALAARVLNQCKILNPVQIFKSGQECIDYFEKTGSRAAGTLPCLLLLDLAMSPTSGVDVLRHLRDSPNAKDSVLVMLSGVTDYKIIHEGYQLGATTFLFKPLRPEDVLRMIKAMRGLTVNMTGTSYILSPRRPGEEGRLSPTEPIQNRSFPE
jgi:CheY-like chemotaxis protein